MIVGLCRCWVCLFVVCCLPSLLVCLRVGLFVWWLRCCLFLGLVLFGLCCVRLCAVVFVRWFSCVCFVCLCVFVVWLVCVCLLVDSVVGLCMCWFVGSLMRVCLVTRLVFLSLYRFGCLFVVRFVWFLVFVWCVCLSVRVLGVFAVLFAGWWCEYFGLSVCWFDCPLVD